MDENTLRFLRENQTPSELYKKAFKIEKPWREERQKLLDFSRDHRLSRDEQEKVRKLVDFNDRQGVYERSSLVVDEKAAKEIERYHEKKIEKNIADGKIKRFDPSKDPQALDLYRKTLKKKK